MVMEFAKGLQVTRHDNPLGFAYGPGVYGPPVEVRRLDDIRPSLKNPDVSGPNVLYAIAMDVGKVKHKEVLGQHNILLGLVTFAQGRLGSEPIRSQGHVHAESQLSGYSTPEVYEVWQGGVVVLMQEFVTANPGRCFAVYAKEGEIVVVPPYWAHATISWGNGPLTFAAWCVRDYGFEYEGVRVRSGLAWYPTLSRGGELAWEPNPNYGQAEIIEKRPRAYSDLGIRQNEPIYTQFEQDHRRFDFVSNPKEKISIWETFEP